MNKKEYELRLQACADAFQRGRDAWIEAGRILAELVKEDSNTYVNLIDKYPLFNNTTLSRLEKLGTMQLHIDLLIVDQPGLLALRHLPYSQQVKYLKESIDMVVHTANGTEILQVMAINITKAQAKQVFARTHVRTLPEQKAWLVEEQDKFQNGKTALPPAYRIVKGKLEVLAHCEFTKAKLQKIIDQL